jgi:hypothetical protein
MRNILLEPVELVGKHLGLLKQASPFTSFYSLEAADIDGAPIDFEAYRDKARSGAVFSSHASEGRKRLFARTARVRGVCAAR